MTDSVDFNGERNLWNGILAQQHPDTGMIAYFLPLHAGAQKIWGTPTDDFWCCHGSLVQAHTMYADSLSRCQMLRIPMASWTARRCWLASTLRRRTIRSNGRPTAAKLIPTTGSAALLWPAIRLTRVPSFYLTTSASGITGVVTTARAVSPNDIRLIPLYEGRDEMYTVYFSVVGSVPA